MFVRKIFGNYQSICGGISLLQNPMLSTYSSEPFPSGCVWCIKIIIWDASVFIYSWNFLWKCIKSKTRQPRVLFRQKNTASCFSIGRTLWFCASVKEKILGKIERYGERIALLLCIRRNKWLTSPNKVSSSYETVSWL